MATEHPHFADRAAHRAWLNAQSALPAGFRVGCERFPFTVAETGGEAAMTCTLLVADRPSPDFAAVFTRNAFPGAPVTVGRARLAEAALGAIVVNNKISNVAAAGGIATAEAICAATGDALGIPASAVLPSSTGVIGWRLPQAELCAAATRAAGKLSADSILPAAEGIVTTDRYAKVRRVALGGGSIVGIAKGAGMVEPNLATMLVYILTDLAIPRERLRALLPVAVGPSFNAISIDMDQSTSDTVVLWSSGAVPWEDEAAFAAALNQVCADLAEDVVRNGEGVHHVQRVSVGGAPSAACAQAVGKAVVNSPLWKTALAGNDPNVGRLLMAVGKELGNHWPEVPSQGVRISLADETLVSDGCFQLDPEKEKRLVAALEAAELYRSTPDADGRFFAPGDWPEHGAVVDIQVDLAAGDANASVLGNDLTHEYITENADYRS